MAELVQDSIDAHARLGFWFIGHRMEIIGFVRLAEAVEPLCCGSAEGREKLRQQAITAALEDETGSMKC